jgi:hypothetical protein
MKDLQILQQPHVNASIKNGGQIHYLMKVGMPMFLAEKSLLMNQTEY